MRRLKSPKCFFAVFVIACAGAWLYGAWRHSPQSEPKSPPTPEFQVIEGLAVKQRDLDLGTVWEDDVFHFKLPIENRSGSEIRVVDFAFT